MKDFIFVATIKRLKEFIGFYESTVNYLKSKDFKQIDEWLDQIDKESYELKDMAERKEFFYENYRANLKKCDFVILDISVESRTVQYQIAMALFEGKRTICLRHKNGDEFPFILKQIEDKNLEVYEYENNVDLVKRLKDISW